MRRTVALVLLVLVVVALVLLDLGESEEAGEAITRAPGSGGPLSSQHAEDGGGPGVPTLAGNPPRRSRGPELADVAMDPPPALTLDSLTAAWIEVTLDAPPDWQANDGVVYALPAGSEGADELEWMPHARRDGEHPGPLRIPLPAAGTWDVGFTGMHGQAFVRDVVVAEGDAAFVHMTFPGYAPVRVHLRDPLPSSMPTGSVVRVEVLQVASETPRQRYLPGRHEQGYVVGFVVFRAPGTQATQSLPPARELRVRAYAAAPSAPQPTPVPAVPSAKPSWRLVGDPSTVQAGGSVEVSNLVRGVVDLRIRYAGSFPKSWNNWGVWLHFYSQIDDGLAQGAGIWIGPNHNPPMPKHAVVHTDPGRVRISWNALGVFEGAIEPFDVASGEVVRREVVIRIDESFDPANPPDQPDRVEASPIRLHLRGAPKDTKGELVVFGLCREEDGYLRVEQEHFDHEATKYELLGDDWRRIRRVQATLGISWASRPVSIPDWGDLEIHLKPAGLVQVAPALIPPPELGAVTVRLRDGTLFRSGRFDDEELGLERDIGSSASGRPGTILGPLPVGSYEFEVWVGRLKHSTARVQVRQGRIAVLRILE